jgi:hypothetical protein
MSVRYGCNLQAGQGSISVCGPTTLTGDSQDIEQRDSRNQRTNKQQKLSMVSRTDCTMFSNNTALLGSITHHNSKSMGNGYAKVSAKFLYPEHQTY